MFGSIGAWDGLAHQALANMQRGMFSEAVEDPTEQEDRVSNSRFINCHQMLAGKKAFWLDKARQQAVGGVCGPFSAALGLAESLDEQSQRCGFPGLPATVAT